MAGDDKQQKLRGTLAGIRARTPKRTPPTYDEPSENERRLRGVAKRTPKKTMAMDEKDAKESPSRKATGKAARTTAATKAGSAKEKTGAGRPVPSMANVNARKKLLVGNPKDSSDSTASANEVASHKGFSPFPKNEDTKTVSGKETPEPAAKTVAAAPRSAKKKSRLRRAVSAVGRGVRKMFRGRGKNARATAGRGSQAKKVGR